MKLFKLYFFVIRKYLEFLKKVFSDLNRLIISFRDSQEKKEAKLAIELFRILSYLTIGNIILEITINVLDIITTLMIMSLTIIFVPILFLSSFLPGYNENYEHYLLFDDKMQESEHLTTAPFLAGMITIFAFMTSIFAFAIAPMVESISLSVPAFADINFDIPLEIGTVNTLNWLKTVGALVMFFVYTKIIFGIKRKIKRFIYNRKLLTKDKYFDYECSGVFFEQEVI